MVAQLPFRLASRVASLDGFDDPFGRYARLGAESREAIVRLLPEGWAFEGRRVLDFGSGADPDDTREVEARGLRRRVGHE